MSDEPVASVYMSWGLWVARCPRPGCLGAEHFGHAPITGLVGGLTRIGFRCARCAMVCRADWPANADEIMAVLAARPLAETRSWALHETIEDLLAENAAYGHLPRDLPAGPLSLNGRLTPAGLALTAASAVPAIGV